MVQTLCCVYAGDHSEQYHHVCVARHCADHLPGSVANSLVLTEQEGPEDGFRD